MHTPSSFPLTTTLALWLFLSLGTGSLVHGQAHVPFDRGGGLRVEGNQYTQSVLYRPSSAEYRFWDGDRFNLIYQERAGDMAGRTKRALQSTWPRVDSMVGPVSSDFETPVVISAYSDRGGGRVRVFPFYQENEAVSLKVPDLSRHSTWPRSVAPHELVHSAHLEVDVGVGLGGLVRPFAPDWARGFNGLFPIGAGEGAAVYLESQIGENAGRLNEPLFTMKMKAALLSEDPWSLSQMLGPPLYGRPSARHYIGGAHVFRYLADRGGETSTEFFHDAVTWQNRIPFFGLGPWLGVSVGQFPSQIGSEMRTELRERYSAELERRGPFTDVTTISAKTGLFHRRPYWINDDTLVAYVNGYDVRAGFYRIDANTGERSPIRVQSIAEDRRYGLGRDTTALYAARYVADPLVPSQQTAEIERVNLETGEAAQITEDGGAVAPAEGPRGRVYAAKNDGPFTRGGVVEGDSVRSLTAAEPTSIRQIVPAPGDGPIAVLKNAGGSQQIYRAERTGRGAMQEEPWIGIEGAIIYDVTWGPEGRYLLFTADHPETPCIFAFDREAKEVLRLASVPFGAREPTLSPDRSTLAFVSYQHERYNLVRTDFRPGSAPVLPDSAWTLGRSSLELPPPSKPAVAAESSQPYSAWRHLSPDVVYPALRDSPTEWDQYFGAEADPLAIGVETAGADPLRQWAYRGFLYWEDGRLWGETRLESGQFLLRPSLSVYNRADVPSTDSGPGLEERGIGLGVRLPIILESNVYRSSLQLGLETQLRQTRLYNGGLTGLTPFSERLTLNPRLGLRYRVQRNRRDLIPNTGLTLGVEGEVDPWMEETGPGLGERREALRVEANLYLPFLRDSNTGLRLGAGLLTQNRSSFDPQFFAPRGYDTLPDGPDGTFLRFDAEVVQPLWFIDDGLTIFPVYLGALSAYGFGQTLGRVDSGGWQAPKTSVGGGIGLDVRFFYRFSLKLRVGAAYRLGPGDVHATFR